jgi:cobalt-zinc-cadmium efflux system membrane fusion protein
MMPSNRLVGILRVPRYQWLLFPLVALVVVAVVFAMRHNLGRELPLDAAATSVGESDRQPQAANAPIAEKTGKAAPQLAAEPSPVVQVEFPRSRWGSAGIELAEVQVAELNEVVRVTGKILLNEDRLVHVFPLVEGRVEQVKVRFGDRVKSGEPLVIIQSREIGESKLRLYLDRLLLEQAKVKDRWNQEVAKNTQELVVALRAGESTEAIEAKFRNRPIGENREKLLSAHAALTKSSADLERIDSLAQTGVVEGKRMLAAKATRDVDWATFQAWLEQTDQQTRYNALLSSQLVQEAQARLAVAEASLKILGYTDADLEQVLPSRQGSSLSHYTITAPFDGTVISKDLVLWERVQPDRQILGIADLSTVWVSADIYEQYVPLLASLAGKTIRVRSNAWPEETFEAKVFYTGDMVDDASRAVSLRAIAENTRGLLKPGMFIEVELPGSHDLHVTQVPDAAIQEHAGKTLVFVSRDDGFEAREVKLGRRSGNMVEVSSGLTTGDKIAVRGGFAIKSQMLAELIQGE